MRREKWATVERTTIIMEAIPQMGKTGNAKTSRATWLVEGCCWHKYRIIVTAQKP